MKDEINEILDRMQELVKHKYDKKIQTYNLFDDIQGLLDYITNLQEKDKEIDRLNNIIDEMFEWMQNKYDNSDLAGFTVSFQELEDLKELKKIKNKGE